MKECLGMKNSIWTTAPLKMWHWYIFTMAKAWIHESSNCVQLQESLFMCKCQTLIALQLMSSQIAVQTNYSCSTTHARIVLRDAQETLSQCLYIWRATVSKQANYVQPLKHFSVYNYSNCPHSPCITWALEGHFTFANSHAACTYKHTTSTPLCFTNRFVQTRSEDCYLCPN